MRLVESSGREIRECVDKVGVVASNRINFIRLPAPRTYRIRAHSKVWAVRCSVHPLLSPASLWFAFVGMHHPVSLNAFAGNKIDDRHTQKWRSWLNFIYIFIFDTVRGASNIFHDVSRGALDGICRTLIYLCHRKDNNNRNSVFLVRCENANEKWFHQYFTYSSSKSGTASKEFFAKFVMLLLPRSLENANNIIV